MSKLFYLQVLTFTLTLSSCGSPESDTSVNTAPKSCTSQPDKNQLLWKTLNQHYLWQDRLDQQTQVAHFDSLRALLADVTKKNPIDRFSFIGTDRGINFEKLILEGIGISYGMDYQIEENNQALIVTQVFKQGSAQDLGLKRGDKIIRIQNQDIVSAVNNALLETEQFTQNRSLGHQVQIQWQNAQGLHTGMLEHRQIKVNAVIHQQIIQRKHHKIGYLVFYLFTPGAVEELNQVFRHFVREQVDTLIIDLRYNGGGCCINTQLESQIAGENVLGKLAGRLLHNNQLNHKNQSEFFALKNSVPAFDMQQVIFLTTGATASASEAVINKLKPYIDVKLVGEKTYGKPVGTALFDICGETAFISINQGENANGYGDYFQGLDVDCKVEDKVSGNWGQGTEPLLKEAIYLLENGHCSS